MSIVSLTIALCLKQKYILKLKLTSRIIRTVIILFIINATWLLFINLLTYQSRNNITLLHLMALLLPITIIISNYINYPIQAKINNHYIKRAKQILYSNKEVIKIAITGSYGKTSTKYILDQILSNYFITLKTPKSYNTLLGIARTINQDFHNNVELFLCEMGAFRVGEIKEMTDFIKPHISIITEVGPQHLSTFKNIENIASAKWEIMSDPLNNHVGIINGDNQYLLLMKALPSQDIIKVGLNDSNDIYANNINIIDGITTFDIVNKNIGIVEHIETSLLGEHNIYNILISYGVICALRKFNINVSDYDFKKAINTVQSAPHRLNYHCQENLSIYDDSYSGNIKGITNAIKVLSNVNGYKAIITPGIVDAGKSCEELNIEIAKKMATVFDSICLINNEAASFIATYLDKINHHYTIYSNFQEAYQYIQTMSENKHINLLIANDLPDNFLERRKKWVKKRT